MSWQMWKLIKWGCKECQEACGFNFRGQMEFKTAKSFWGVFPQLGRRGRVCLAGFFVFVARPFSTKQVYCGFHVVSKTIFKTVVEFYQTKRPSFFQRF